MVTLWLVRVRVRFRIRARVKNVTERRNLQNFPSKKEKFQAVPDTGDFLGLFWVPTWDFSKK